MNPQRLRLWREDPRCFWCGHETVLEGRHHPRLATIDHLYSRFHPARKRPHPNERRRVLACYQCNQRRARAEERALPRAVIHERSTRPPKSRRPGFILDWNKIVSAS